MGNPPATGLIIDLGFVVDWQLTDDAPGLIDLSSAETEVLLPDDATIEASFGRTT